jgi:hypothetical protein
VAAVPTWFLIVVRGTFLLSSYFLEFFRSLYGVDGKVGEVLIWGFGLNGFNLAIEAVLFKWVIHLARKNGTFIKLSE